MVLDSGSTMDSAMFTDLRLSWNPAMMDDALTISVGLNNLLDEDPPVCDACGVIGMSPVSHDLPGTVGYVRVTYQN
jgi:iron complex outermembrane receptor protein